MQKIKDIICNPFFIIFVIIFIIGFSLGRVDNWDMIKVNTDINFDFFDLLSLFITAGVAIYIAKILKSDLQKKQSSRDVWIYRFVQLETILARIDKTLSEPTIYSDSIVCSLHQLRSKLSHMKKTLESSNNKLSEDNELTQLMTNINALRRLLTETPVNTNQKHNTEETKIKVKEGKIIPMKRENKVNENIKIENGVVTYSRNHLNEVRSNMALIDNSIFLLKLKFASTNTITLED